MATNKTKTTEMFDTVVKSQKDFVNQMVDKTKELTKNIPYVNETLDKSKQFYNETIDASSKNVKDAAEKMEVNFNKMNTENYFQSWFENQMNMAKTMFNSNNNNQQFDWMNMWKNFSNPFQNNNNWMNMNWMNNNMFQNPFMNMNNNPMAEGMNQWNSYFQQFMDQAQNMYGDWYKQFSNFTSADSFQGMKNMTDSLNSFFALWTPMFEKMQKGEFKAEDLQNMMNPEAYKTFMDKFFSFMPDDAKKMYDMMSLNFVDYMKKMNEVGTKSYNTFRSNMQNHPFAQYMNSNSMMDMYNTWRTAMNEAVSPLTKLMADNNGVKQAIIWNEIYDKMMTYNIKNSELQYLMYQHGNKVMEEVAKDVYNKIQAGENFDSIIKIYQQWMMKGDEIFTKLFESDEYSKLMTEVSSLQMQLKMDIEKQMEKLFFANMPLATRTEMDEVYKNLYDLKKMYRNLEKLFGVDYQPEAATESKKAEPKASKKASRPTVKKVVKPTAKKTAKKK